MFDVGFWEICMVGLVSLLVIGPERLPKAARIAGYWLGKTRSMVAAVKAEIKEELQAEEIRQTLREHASLEDLNETISEVKQASQNLKESIDSVPKQLSGKTKPVDE
ncbi:Sec-independent protein translocase protein TatB [Methylicorpusculum oleiharenae]|uniref:Sec-independent protein translocase protein TatB n=1 Tax=Methylicorpusculum oleiharenae TaxID=1338687 RepID=UPI0013598667|nr:Sec-independent protein translocase protein TatB [Methylicorpusculum oleiharenae]MCD2449782.1 Sec-independent protein translocase protein TatB [Methylicorpusculum oleiharenae]MCD2452886.1 Sec-independent protein translocase protein TatB [Methylicorpusculum oleiharenae]